MYLYHGTYEHLVETIIKEKRIWQKTKNSATEDLDYYLEKYLEKDVRGGCIYLCDYKYLTGNYSNGFKIPLSSLNRNMLYIADMSKADNLFKLIALNYEKEEIIKECLEYEKSIVPFSEDLKYEKSEYLYFGEIEDFENISKEILNETFKEYI